jgi:hypothetical protein
MKQKLINLSFFGILAIVLVLAPVSSFAGDPIPGLDVKLGKNPGGSLITTQSTGQNGEVTFTGLKAGESYLLSFDQRQLEFAIKEQGVKAPSTLSFSITMTVKHGEVSVNGKKLDKKEEFDITDPKIFIEVTADKNGEIRATINTSRSNIKHRSN